jgi:hypothetical protein
MFGITRGDYPLANQCGKTAEAIAILLDQIGTAGSLPGSKVAGA